MSMEKIVKGNEVNAVIDVFYRTVNPAVSYVNKHDRDAAQWLINKLGLDQVLQLAEYAISLFGVPYAPQITTTGQLKAKLALLGSYHQRTKAVEKKKSKVIDLSKL